MAAGAGRRRASQQDHIAAAAGELRGIDLRKAQLLDRMPPGWPGIGGAPPAGQQDHVGLEFATISATSSLLLVQGNDAGRPAASSPTTCVTPSGPNKVAEGPNRCCTQRPIETCAARKLQSVESARNSPIRPTATMGTAAERAMRRKGQRRSTAKRAAAAENSNSAKPAKGEPMITIGRKYRRQEPCATHKWIQVARPITKAVRSMAWCSGRFQMCRQRITPHSNSRAKTSVSPLTMLGTKMPTIRASEIVPAKPAGVALKAAAFNGRPTLAHPLMDPRERGQADQVGGRVVPQPDERHQREQGGKDRQAQGAAQQRTAALVGHGPAARGGPYDQRHDQEQAFETR